jgi:hypothetical protein
MARKRHPKPGTLADLQRVLWAMIRRVERLSDDDAQADRVLRCAHALSQLSSAYKSVIEAADLDARIKQLERVTERNGHHEFS